MAGYATRNSFPAHPSIEAKADDAFTSKLDHLMGSGQQESLKLLSAFLILSSLVTNRVFWLLAGTLAMIDVIFISAHVAVVLADKFSVDPSSFRIAWDRFRIDVDGSYSELYEYFKSAVCAAALLFTYLKRREVVYVLFAGIFVVALLDNALQVHERIGSELFGSSSLGELLAYAIMGITSAIFLWLSWPSSKQDVAYAAGCTLVVLALAFFTVLLDLIHSLVPLYVAHTEQLLGLVEEGGELLALTFSVALTCNVALDSTRPDLKKE